MSKVSHFQRFSQRENHATNNTLLLLRHVYQTNPAKLERILQEILETDISIGLTFAQQIKGSQSIPDALISQPPFRIFVETKLGDELDHAQIRNHVASISASRPAHGNDESILLGLTRREISKADADALAEHAADNGVIFRATTFAAIADSARSVCESFETNLISIVEDYRSYLDAEGLLEHRGRRMIIFPCGVSRRENLDYGVYYEGTHRPLRSQCRFLGAYHNKQVVGIGEVLAIGALRYAPTGMTVVEAEHGTFTPEMLDRVHRMVEATKYYNLKGDPDRYYVLDQMIPISLRKASPGPVRGGRYIALADYVKDLGVLDRIATPELAKALDGKSFT